MATAKSMEIRWAEDNIPEETLRYLAKSDCLRFPVDARKIARTFHYRTAHYTQGARLLKKFRFPKNKLPYALSFSWFNRYHILISSRLTPDMERKVIAHEMGHIYLQDLDNPEKCSPHHHESEAEAFALHLLAPLPLLAGYPIRSPQDVEQLTRLDSADSAIVFRWLTEYCSRPHLVFSHTPYIRHLRLKIAAVCTACAAAIVLLTGNLCSTPAQAAPFDNVPIYETSAASDPFVSENTPFYWTDDRLLYHSHADCCILQYSDTVYEGPLSDAQAGHERLCSLCEQRG